MTAGFLSINTDLGTFSSLDLGGGDYAIISATDPTLPIQETGSIEVFGSEVHLRVTNATSSDIFVNDNRIQLTSSYVEATKDLDVKEKIYLNSSEICNNQTQYSVYNGTAFECVNRVMSFYPVRNNTDLGNTGTGERVAGRTYNTSNFPIEILLIAHSNIAGQVSTIELSINGTNVSKQAGIPIGSAQETYRSIDLIIPAFSNYSANITDFHHYEWREYPILSSNQTINFTTITNSGISSLGNLTNTTNHTLLYVYQTGSNQGGFSAGVSQKVRLDAKLFDPYGDWETTNSSFNASISGYYEIVAHVTLLTPVANNAHTLRVLNNGTSILESYDQSRSNDPLTNLIVAGVVHLNKGNVIYIDLAGVTGTGMSVYARQQATYMTINYVRDG